MNNIKSLNWSFIGLVALAIFISYLPIVSVPFTWVMTFFHEISHGIAALITGGSVDNIHIYLNGSGLCYTKGGIKFIVTFSGYTGAVIWGVLLYMMADRFSHKRSNIIAFSISGLILISALLWGRDVLTLVILAILFCLFVSIVQLQETWVMKLTLKFIGIFVLLDAVKAPLNLIDGRHYGDGATLSDLTWIPEILWVIVWFIIGMGGLLYIWRIGGKVSS